MTLGALIALARERLDDELEPYLVSDASLAGWATEGEREACVRARLLFDDDANDLTRIALVLGRGIYALDERVLSVVSAHIHWASGGAPCRLALKGLAWIREQSRRADSLGTPRVAADDGRARLHVWPRPVQAGQLHLTVYRAPLRPLVDPADEPEIARRHQDGLVDWMLYRAYQIKDREIEDLTRAAQALRDFTERFGERSSADVQRRHRERRRTTTRYGGY